MYRVHFWVRLRAGDIQMKYVVDYLWLKDEGRAIVCLPGRDSVWYAVNTLTVLQRGRDGECFYTIPEWGRAVHAVLRQSF